MTTDPLGDFFCAISHRLDLFKQIVPVGNTWPTIDTGDLYNQWLRDSHNRREVQLLQERTSILLEENKRLRRALIESSGPEPRLPTIEEWEALRTFAPGLVALIENAKPVVAREHVEPAGPPLRAEQGPAS